MILCSVLGVNAADWRMTGSDAEKLKNLMTAVPGTSHWLFEIGERYKNLYWAAKQEKWEFANYQLEEIEKIGGDGPIDPAKTGQKLATVSR